MGGLTHQHPLGFRQWACLGELISDGGALTTREIHEAICPDDSWHQTKTYDTLSRLENHGLVVRGRFGNAAYWVLRTSDRTYINDPRT